MPLTLLIYAKDDLVEPVHYSLVYEHELRKVGVDVKLIIYESGGHAFGARKQGKDADRWTEDAFRWLPELNILRLY